MQTLSDLFKALSDPNRLRIVAALTRRDELCACQLTELIRVTGATASRHMGVLVSAGLVESRKDGRWVHYRLCRARPELCGLYRWMEGRMAEDPDLGGVGERLKGITACEPSELSRQQRDRAAPAVL